MKNLLSLTVALTLAGGSLRGVALPRNLDFSLGPCVLQVGQPCTNNQTIFYLYRGGETQGPYKLELESGQIPPNYNPQLTLKIVIHGYAGNSNVDHTSKIVQEYLRDGRYNVLVVNWSQLAKVPCYPTASINTRQVGKCTGEAVSTLQHRSYIHAVGFSLGAHVAAFASNYHLYLKGRKFDRITGLDPALPFFATPKASLKLDASDADFVDVIHTNPGVFGKIEPSGHVDFYVNGATIQPVCVDQQNPPLCSHMMAALLFAESIHSTQGFWATPCSSFFSVAFNWCEMSNNSNLILMGEHVNQSNKGIYQVKTGATSPFALGLQTSKRRHWTKRIG